MSIKQIRRFFITIILTIMLAITIAFDFGTTDSWAANLPSNQANAMTKNVEGSLQCRFRLLFPPTKNVSSVKWLLPITSLLAMTA